MSFVFWGVLLGLTLAAGVWLVRPALARSGQPTWSIVVIAFLLPFAALALYLSIGSPDSLEPAADPITAQMPTPKSDGSGGIPAVEDLLGGLESRLAADPHDADGWLLLARSYEHLGRSADAEQARSKWQALGGAETVAEESATTAGVDAKIRGTVAVDPGLRSSIGQNDVLFVIARAVEGPPIPVAVLKADVGELPLEFALTDDMAMVDGMELSRFATVAVSARVSRTGDATPHAGDLVAEARIARVGDGAPVELIIDHEHP